jgi:hypothetical protein
VNVASRACVAREPAAVTLALGFLPASASPAAARTAAALEKPEEPEEAGSALAKASLMLATEDDTALLKLLPD